MDLIENGKDANEVLKMPFHYVLPYIKIKTMTFLKKKQRL